MSHLLNDHPDWPNAMTTPTPRTDALDAELGVSDLRIGDAGRYRKLASQLERDLAAAHEELNTQAHELERLLNELAAAQSELAALKGLAREMVPDSALGPLSVISERLLAHYKDRFALSRPTLHTDNERQVLVIAIKALRAALTYRAAHPKEGT